MAFTITNLTCVTNNQKAGNVPTLWLYYNADGDTMTDAGAITTGRFTVGDQVNVIDADYGNNTFYNVTVVTAAGVVTLVANS